MAKTKLSTFLRSMLLVLFLVSWVSLKTIVKDGNFPVSTNGVKGKNKLRFLIPFTHILNSADEDSSRKNCLRKALLVITDKSWNSLHSSQQMQVSYPAFFYTKKMEFRTGFFFRGRGVLAHLKNRPLESIVGPEIF